MTRPAALLPCLVASLLLPAGAAAEEIIPLAGEVPSGEPLHQWVFFEVPEGIVEIEVRHDDLSATNILDWGLYDPSGAFRGYGGDNTEPAIVSVDRASRSYLAGPIAKGTWRIHIGKAKIADAPAHYQIEVHLRDAPTLPPQPERAPYQPVAALEKGPRFYAGDFHVHSRESGDASPSLDEIAAYARSRGLDFAELSDHNTVSQLDFLSAAQARQGAFLFLPGVEWTTYQGHGNGIGALSWVDHKTGFEGETADKAIEAFLGQGALFSINHPAVDLGDLCIGCAWAHDVPREKISAVEVINGSATLVTKAAIGFWDELCDAGAHAAALGGSDDHRAGVDETGFNHPIGEPTTMVYAEELSVAAILAGIKNGRTVVRATPEAPMAELRSSVAPTGDTVVAGAATLSVKVTGAAGGAVRFVKNGARLPSIDVTADPFETSTSIAAPASGEDRYRVEVLVASQLQTITSHLWVKAPPPPQGTGGNATAGAGGSQEPSDPASPGGCGCAVAGASAPVGLLPLLAIAAAAGRRRRGRDREALSLGRCRPSDRRRSG